MAKFSILCPVYNVEKYLSECIESVLNQTFGDFELILMDDGSTDSSGKICDSYASKDSRIKFFRKDNGGPLETRCSALREARGEWVLFLDSDDWLVPEALQTVYDYSVEHNPDCIIFSIEKVFPSHSELIGVKNSEKPALVTNLHDFYKMVSINGNCNSLCRKAVLREKIGKRDFSEFYHIFHGEDRLQSIEIYENCTRFLIVPDILYKYRFVSNSITNLRSFNPAVLDSVFTVSEQMLMFLQKLNLFSDSDYDELRRSEFDCLMNNYVKAIARSGIRFCEKVVLYEKIKAERYYKDFLEYGNINGAELMVFYRQMLFFKNGDYRVLSFLGWLSTMKRRMFR